jgi:hypothetical protein
MKGKPLVQLSAAPFTEYERRKAVGASPLEWSRLAVLARSHRRNALKIEEAA